MTHRIENLRAHEHPPHGIPADRLRKDSMKRNFIHPARGLTIIQVMVILFFVGIIGTVVVNLIIDMRCQEVPASSLCSNRGAGGQ